MSDLWDPEEEKKKEDGAQYGIIQGGDCEAEE